MFLQNKTKIEMGMSEKCLAQISGYSFCIVHVFFLLLFMYVHLM